MPQPIASHTHSTSPSSSYFSNNGTDGLLSTRMAAMKADPCMLLIALLCSCSSRWWCTSADPLSKYNHRATEKTTPLYASKQSINNDPSYSRREILHHGVVVVAIGEIFTPNIAKAASPALPLQTTSGTVRVEGIGGGLDLLTPKPLSNSDVFYPSSMANTKWEVKRVVTSVEGDLGQAELAWKLLGGYDERALGGYDERAFTSKLTEVYETHFMSAPESMKDAYYQYDGTSLHASISDRGYELSTRMGLPNDTIQWDVNKANNSIDYTRNNDAVNLTIVQRKIELPSDSGFGSDEIYRIQSSAGGIFAGTNVYRAARVRRRYRRGFDEGTGKRILDCIEIVTTHRVLDGIAGIELPTSTCKSRMRFTQL